MFSEYYFYLIAYAFDDDQYLPKFFRADRIVSMTEHQEHFTLERKYDFDEGDLREKNQFFVPREDGANPVCLFRSVRTGNSGQTAHSKGSGAKRQNQHHRSGSQPRTRHYHVPAVAGGMGKGAVAAESGGRNAGRTASNAGII